MFIFKLNDGKIGIREKDKDCIEIYRDLGS